MQEFFKIKIMRKTGNFAYYFIAVVFLLSFYTHGCLPEQEEEVLAVVTTDEISDVAETLAVFKGTLISAGNSAWVDRGVFYSNFIKEPDVTHEYFWADGGAHTGKFTVIMENLTPGTRYYARAYAINNAGNSYGDIINFTTTGSVTGSIEFKSGLTYGQLSDVEGNIYKTIEIGDQTWMAENLRTTKYNDGSDIPVLTGNPDWAVLTTPYYCWYLDDGEKYKNIFGALYNWYAVNTGKLCPAGWHVPDDSEWDALAEYEGGEDEAGTKLKEIGLDHWVMTKSDVTNNSGFTALPGGMRWGIATEPLKYFSDMGYSGYFWSSTEKVDTEAGFNGASIRRLTCNKDSIIHSSFVKSQFITVRCIQD